MGRVGDLSFTALARRQSGIETDAAGHHQGDQGTDKQFQPDSTPSQSRPVTPSLGSR